jgi:glycosyltransferase involved in cell wall biosynthesis
MKLTLIVPVYNEAANIAKLIDKASRQIKFPFRLIVIYDFNEDNTIPVVKKLQKQYSQIELVKNNHGKGKGVINAIKTGFDLVKDGAVVVIMADLADDLTTINAMFKKIGHGFDVVCGSRFSGGGKKIGGPLVKSLLARTAGLLTPMLLKIPTRDITNAFKMYKKEVLDSVTIESRGGFELAMEIAIKAHNQGFKVTEVPTVWRDRTMGVSRFKFFAWLPHYLYWYLWGFSQRLGKFGRFDYQKP